MFVEIRTQYVLVLKWMAQRYVSSRAFVCFTSQSAEWRWGQVHWDTGGETRNEDKLQRGRGEYCVARTEQHPEVGKTVKYIDGEDVFTCVPRLNLWSIRFRFKTRVKFSVRVRVNIRVRFKVRVRVKFRVRFRVRVKIKVRFRVRVRVKISVRVGMLFRSFIFSLIHSFIHSFFHSFFHSFIQSFIHSFIQPSNQSINQSFIETFCPSVFQRPAGRLDILPGCEEGDRRAHPLLQPVPHHVRLVRVVGRVDGVAGGADDAPARPAHCRVGAGKRWHWWRQPGRPGESSVQQQRPQVYLVAEQRVGTAKGMLCTSGGRVGTTKGMLCTSGGRVGTTKGMLCTSGGRVGTTKGMLCTSGGRVGTTKGMLCTSGGRVGTAKGMLCTSGGRVGTAKGMLCTSGVESGQLKVCCAHQGSSRDS